MHSTARMYKKAVPIKYIKGKTLKIKSMIFVFKIIE